MTPTIRTRSRATEERSWALVYRERSHVIRATAHHGISSIAGFRVRGHTLKSAPTIRKARRRLGRPSSIRRNDVSCRARWDALGLTIDFVNDGLGNPCLLRLRAGPGQFVPRARPHPGLLFVRESARCGNRNHRGLPRLRAHRRSIGQQRRLVPRRRVDSGPRRWLLPGPHSAAKQWRPRPRLRVLDRRRRRRGRSVAGDADWLQRWLARTGTRSQST